MARHMGASSDHDFSELGYEESDAESNLTDVRPSMQSTINESLLAFQKTSFPPDSTNDYLFPSRATDSRPSQTSFVLHASQTSGHFAPQTSQNSRAALASQTTTGPVGPGVGPGHTTTTQHNNNNNNNGADTRAESTRPGGPGRGRLLHSPMSENNINIRPYSHQSQRQSSQRSRSRARRSKNSSSHQKRSKSRKYSSSPFAEAWHSATHAPIATPIPFQFGHRRKRKNRGRLRSQDANARHGMPRRSTIGRTTSTPEPPRDVANDRNDAMALQGKYGKHGNVGSNRKKGGKDALMGACGMDAMDGTGRTGAESKDKEQNEEKGTGGISYWGLVFLGFFWVCGGNYGSETLAKDGSPSYVFAALLLIPLFYSLPISLMTAELATTFPENAGAIVFIRECFRSQGLAWHVSLWSWLICVGDSCIYPIFASEYAKTFVHDLHELYPHNAVLNHLNEYDTKLWVGIPSVLLVTLINLRGITMVVKLNMLLMTITLVPSLLYIFWNVQKIDFGIITKYDDDDGVCCDISLLFSFILWYNSGYGSLGVMAGEIHSKRRRSIYLLAILTLLPMSYFLYSAPLLVSLSLTGPEDWHDYKTGYYTTLAKEYVGPWLQCSIILAAVIAFVGMYNGIILYGNVSLHYLMETSQKALDSAASTSRSSRSINEDDSSSGSDLADDDEGADDSNSLSRYLDELAGTCCLLRPLLSFNNEKSPAPEEAARAEEMERGRILTAARKSVLQMDAEYAQRLKNDNYDALNRTDSGAMIIFDAAPPGAAAPGAAANAALVVPEPGASYVKLKGSSTQGMEFDADMQRIQSNHTNVSSSSSSNTVSLTPDSSHQQQQRRGRTSPGADGTSGNYGNYGNFGYNGQSAQGSFNGDESIYTYDSITSFNNSSPVAGPQGSHGNASLRVEEREEHQQNLASLEAEQVEVASGTDAVEEEEEEDTGVRRLWIIVNLCIVLVLIWWPFELIIKAEMLVFSILEVMTVLSFIVLRIKWRRLEKKVEKMEKDRKTLDKMDLERIDLAEAQRLASMGDKDSMRSLERWESRKYSFAKERIERLKRQMPKMESDPEQVYTIPGGYFGLIVVTVPPIVVHIANVTISLGYSDTAMQNAAAAGAMIGFGFVIDLGQRCLKWL